MVNETRKEGFLEGLRANGLKPEEADIYMDCKERTDVEHAVEDCLRSQADCIICMDDRICSNALEKLKSGGIVIPEQIRVASFYDSILLENSLPAVTSLRYDPRNLGVVAAKNLFRLIAEEAVEEITYLDYEVALKGSTQ